MSALTFPDIPGIDASIDDASARSSSKKVLGVIDLFTEEASEWTIDAIAVRLKLARTTAYRYARTLSDAGFLASMNAGTFVLGPRIIQLDRQIRLADPLLRVGPPVMASIRKRVSGIQLLCSHYGDQVICIHDDRGDAGITSSYDRGRPFPLFRGGPSRVILAHLPNRQLRSLMLNHAPDIARAGLGANWKEFSRAMRQLREAGYYATRGEIHPENFGVAAPILTAGGVAGCISLARSLERLKDGDIPMLIELALEAAGRISEEIRKGA
jgi:DNA-binding IclR family transcriptional regulator